MYKMADIKTLDLYCWVYDVIPERCYHIVLGEYNTYGIKVTGSEFAMVLHDVSVCKDIADNFVEMFNKYQLSPVHVEEVIMDMLP